MFFDRTKFFERRIRKNQKSFLEMEARIQNSTDLDVRNKLACMAAQFAITHSTDIFSSPIIETAFLEQANACSVELSDSYAENTVLHVMTEAYIFGGHTRCVERWIQQFPEQKHSCVILSQNVVLPTLLKTVVENSGGELRLYEPKQEMKTKALLLRQYASSFKYVVLHIHMHDPTALIAFGTEEFKRPIIFFNHADHIFWLGISIADYVADINYNRHPLTLKGRGAKKASVLGVPQENSNLLKVNQKEARTKIGLPANAKIIFSAGETKKYHPLRAPCFYNIISDLTSSDPDIRFYIAGVDEKEVFWTKLKKKFPNNLFLLGRLDYKTEYPFYLAAADLVLDSYPVGGGAVAIDAINAGKPFLTLNTLTQANFLINSLGHCNSYQELIDKARRVLSDNEYAKTVYSDIHQGLKEEMSPEKWHDRCEKILDSLPERHAIHPFTRQEPTSEISRLSLETTRWVEPYEDSLLKRLKQAKRDMFSIRLKKHEKVIKLFGVHFLRRNNM